MIEHKSKLTPRWLERYHGSLGPENAPKRLKPEIFRRIRHGKTNAPHKPWKRVVATASLGAFLFTSTAGALLFHDLHSQIQKSSVSLDGFVKPKIKPVDDYSGKALNILIIGNDFRHGAGNEQYGEYEGMLNDTNLLMHISADRQRMQIISIPRDTVLEIPSCKLANGDYTYPQYGQFNWSLGIGAEHDPDNLAPGIACVQNTMESLTGLTIDEFVMVDFAGFRSIVDSLGGVNMCFETDLYDPKSDLDIPAGCHTLNGAQAIAFARTRSLPDDPSGDIGRMGRQQQLIGRILETVKQKNLLTDFSRLYAFSKESLKALKVSPALSSLSTSSGLAYSLSGIPNNGIQFATMPWGQSPTDPNRVIPAAEATAVWEALRQDLPLPPGTEVRNLQGELSTIPYPEIPEDGNPNNNPVPSETETNNGFTSETTSGEKNQ